MARITIPAGNCSPKQNVNIIYNYGDNSDMQNALVGSTVPDSNIGNEGDFYYMLLNNETTLYQKLEGIWNNLGTIATSPEQISYTFENGLREENGVVKLGLDYSTIGTTNIGELTEPTYLFNVNGMYGLMLSDIDTSLQNQYGILSFNTVNSGIDRINASGFGGAFLVSDLDTVIVYRTDSGYQTLTFGSSNIVIEDSINQKGFEYFADYSANWTDHSLITKKWAMDTFSGALTFENGLREDNGVVKLGIDLTTIGTTNLGALTEDTHILRGDINTNSYVLNSIMSQAYGVSVSNPGQIILSVSEGVYPGEQLGALSIIQGGTILTAYEIVDDRSSYLFLSGSTLTIGVMDGNNTGSSPKQGFRISPESFMVFEEENSKGLQYFADYSIQGKTDPRWIPDWDAVTSLPRIEAIQAGSNVTITGTGTIADPYVINSTAEGEQIVFDSSQFSGAGTQEDPKKVQLKTVNGESIHGTGNLDIEIEPVTSDNIQF